MSSVLVLLGLAAWAHADSPSYLLTTTNFNTTAFQVQPYVSNGYLSQRIPVEGVGYSEISPINATGHDGTNGWPLFDTRFTAAMVAGFYDYQATIPGTNFPELEPGESPISTLPTWSSLFPTLNNATYAVGVPMTQVANWSQSMSINTGIVQTNISWLPPGRNGSVALSYTLFAHRELANLGVVRLDISGLVSGEALSVTDVLDGEGAWRTDFVSSGFLQPQQIYTAVRPNGIANVTAYEVSELVFSDTPLSNSSSCYSSQSANASTISQCFTFSAPTSGNFSVTKYVGIASSDAFNGTELATAQNAVANANSTGYDSLLASHEAAWKSIWNESDIIIPDNDELQLATRASLFHMLSNVRSGSEGSGLGDNSIAPAGLTSDSYAGQIFWDADIWMFPGLLALYPDYSESIVNFRYRQLGAAIENSKLQGVAGAAYPWTAGRFGNCTAVGPCFSYEKHLGNDISLAVYQYYLSTQNKTWLEEKGWPILSELAEFWAGNVIGNTTTGLYSTLNETDPDEYANFKNNAAYTNAGVTVVLQHAIAIAGILNITVPSNWSAIASNITVLHAPSGITLEYDGFNATTEVKQADVVLLPYPLEYPQSQTSALQDLNFYAGATSASGPGMTYSIFSIDESALSTVGCASWTYLLASSQPYNRPPYYQFSEQTTDVYASNGGTNPAFTFLTGHGGFIQSFTHGFTGYRSRLNALYLDPVLPTQLTNYTVKGLKWGGHTFDVLLTTANTTISLRNGTNSSATIEIGPLSSRAGNYTLNVGETLTIPTRATNGTLVAGNLAQCASVLSNDTAFSSETPAIVPGQYSLAAVDGSNSTTWQPLMNVSTTLTVDLGSSQNLTGAHINWGPNPPISFAIAAGDSVADMTQLSSGNVTISAPYDAATADIVIVRIGNTTDVQFGNSSSNATISTTARYVNLTIAGSFLADGRGGTVAEFVVL